MKTLVLDSVVQCCWNWAVTAMLPGLAQSVPVAFYASPLDWGGGFHAYSVMVASTLHWVPNSIIRALAGNRLP